MINLENIEHSITLTPNRRLSAVLQREFAEHQKHSVWETPKILPINSWIEELWQHHELTHRFQYKLLNPEQEQFLWEQIILKSKQGEYLLRVAETASNVKQAFMLASQWQIDPEHPAFKETTDYQCFTLWRKAFLDYCQQHKLINSSMAIKEVFMAIEKNTIKLEKPINLIGFTDISPLLQTLIHLIQKKGVQVNSVIKSETKCTKAINRIEAKDKEHELYSVACWAKSEFDKNKDTQIACVIPNLESQRNRVLQIFYEVFSKERHYNLELDKLDFNISAGRPLSQYPVIKTAFQLLQLNSNKMTRENFSHILMTPFIGDAEEEKYQRYALDKLLRKNNQHYISPKSICDNIGDEYFSQSCPKLFERFKAFNHLLTEDSKSAYQWTLEFTRMLSVLGWPGERSLNSEEYQTVDNWLKLLQKFSSFDFMAGNINYNQALHILTQLANKTIFQPESPQSSVQILGVLEAASLQFDKIWICGMDNYAWPSQASPNPYLPKKIQVEYQIPHASPERELYYCEQLISQFITGSDRIIFSYSKKNDQVEQKPSPLIMQYNQDDTLHEAYNRFVKPELEIYQYSKTEWLEDHQSKKMQEQTSHQGGSEILKLQALCPFRAFATHRLHARPLEKSQPGLLARDRGKIIHQILETFWLQVKTQENLLKITTEHLDEMISQIVESALLKSKQIKFNNRRYIELEKNRLNRLIKQWLELEKQREDFCVAKMEEAIKIVIDQLSLNLRIDRIDEIGSNQYMIIDYKTGKHNEISSWFGDRPEDPQLPIYVLNDIANTKAISFAQIATGAMKYKGLSANKLSISGIKAIDQVDKTNPIDWNEQIKKWREVFTALSHSYCNGEANVNPKEASTCNFCTLSNLCRTHETNRANLNE